VDHALTGDLIGWVAALVLAIQLLVVAWSDFHTFTIGNRICIALVATVAVAVLPGLAGHPVLGFGPANLLVGAVFFAAAFPLWLWGRIGGGDVKLLAGCGAIAGPAWWSVFLLLASLLSLIAIAALLAVRHWPVAADAPATGQGDSLWQTYRATRHLPLGVPLGLAALAILGLRLMTQV